MHFGLVHLIIDVIVSGSIILSFLTGSKFLMILIVALGAVIIGIVIGILVALIRNNYDRNNKMKVLNYIVKGYVDIIRGTPIILQLMIIYYVVFKLFRFFLFRNK